MGRGRIYEKPLFYDGESIKMTHCYSFVFFVSRLEKCSVFIKPTAPDQGHFGSLLEPFLDDFGSLLGRQIEGSGADF